MSVERKISTDIVYLGLTQTLRDGEIQEASSWEGSLDQVIAKFEEEINNWQSASASRRGPNVLLTMERTKPAPQDYAHPRGNEETIEIIWREVQISIRQAKPILDGVANNSIDLQYLDIIDRDIANGTAKDPYFETEDDDHYKIMNEYARLIRRGITTFATAVPVVRRTISRQNVNQHRMNPGEAYVRDSPPITPPGDWEWLKTADERRRDGRTYTQVEEWTGGKDLSWLLYPSATT